MIINFSQNIKLYGWVDSIPEGQSRRILESGRAYETLDKDCKVGVIIRPFDHKYNEYIIKFQNQLDFLQEYNLIPSPLVGGLDFAKNYVDNFLIRMSNLKVYF